jgi:hypothetical protein
MAVGVPEGRCIKPDSLRPSFIETRTAVFFLGSDLGFINGASEPAGVRNEKRNSPHPGHIVDMLSAGNLISQRHHHWQWRQRATDCQTIEGICRLVGESAWFHQHRYGQGNPSAALTYERRPEFATE